MNDNPLVSYVEQPPIELGEEVAVRFADSKWYESVDLRTVAKIQLMVNRAVCPFKLFNQSLEFVSQGGGLKAIALGAYPILVRAAFEIDPRNEMQVPTVDDVKSLLPEQFRELFQPKESK